MKRFCLLALSLFCLPTLPAHAEDVAAVLAALPDVAAECRYMATIRERLLSATARTGQAKKHYQAFLQQAARQSSLEEIREEGPSWRATS